MAGVGAILGLVSAGIGLAGTIAQGKFAEAQARNDQMQLNQMAAQERAVASRDAQAKNKEGSLLLSKQQAIAASSGGGATDPTVMELAGDIKKETNVQSRELMRQGLEKGQMLDYKGKVGVDMARAQSRISMLGGIGNLIGGVAENFGGISDAFSKYGRGLPTASALNTSPNNSSIPSWYYG